MKDTALSDVCLSLYSLFCPSVHTTIRKHCMSRLVVQVLDEMLPKATGREARIEKKRGRAEKRREREISPGNSYLYPWPWN